MATRVTKAALREVLTGAVRAIGARLAQTEIPTEDLAATPVIPERVTEPLFVRFDFDDPEARALQLAHELDACFGLGIDVPFELQQTVRAARRETATGAAAEGSART